MRKIIAGLFISLDGVVESPESWHLPYFNDEMGEAVGTQQAECDTILLGRRTYEEFAGFWPAQDSDGEMGDLVGYMNDSPKYVVSTTRDSADEWANSTVIGVDEVAKLKRWAGKNISIIGSGTLVRSLLERGLVDELRLLVHPIVVGSGKRLFDEGERTPLTLIDATTFSTGVLALTYGPAEK